MNPSDIRSLISPKFATHGSIETVFGFIDRTVSHKHKPKTAIIAGAAINTAFEVVAKLCQQELDGRWAPASHWDDHPRFTAEDWRLEVSDQNTRLSYIDWVNEQIDWANERIEAEAEAEAEAEG